jgi:hypothetical protein
VFQIVWEILGEDEWCRARRLRGYYDPGSPGERAATAIVLYGCVQLRHDKDALFSNDEACSHDAGIILPLPELAVNLAQSMRFDRDPWDDSQDMWMNFWDVVNGGTSITVRKFDSCYFISTNEGDESCLTVPAVEFLDGVQEFVRSGHLSSQMHRSCLTGSPMVRCCSLSRNDSVTEDTWFDSMYRGGTSTCGLMGSTAVGSSEGMERPL